MKSSEVSGLCFFADVVFAAVDDDEAVADMIMHGVTDEAWASMEERLTGAGVDTYCEIYQGAVDEYLAG